MKKLLLTLAFGAMLATSAFAADIYIIGSNVNNKTWSLSDPDGKFTQTGPDTYEWDGEILGTGFKFNNGTWSNDNMNWGGTSANKTVTIGKPFKLSNGGSSADLKLADEEGNEITVIENPHIVLEWNGTGNPTITITGAGGGEIQWYLAGINGTFVADDDYGAIELYATDDEGQQLESNPFDITVPAGAFKVASTGFAQKYGIYDNPPTITLDNMTATLQDVDGEAGNVPYNLPAGSYICRFNLSTLVVEFIQEGEADFSDWWVNIIGPFNSWTDNGVHPVDGISTTTGLPLDGEGFKVKVNSGGTNDTYYITGSEDAISLNEWHQLTVDTTDGPRIHVAGVNDEHNYTVQFDLTTAQIMVEETSGVENIATDSANAPAEYYNLQGVRVDNPAAGQLIIVKRGETVAKSLVR